MSKILLINSVFGTGSTGRICREMADELSDQGHMVKIAYGRESQIPDRYREQTYRIGNDRIVKLHGIYTRLTDRHGLGSKIATKSFLRWAVEFDPEILWLHNIHGYYLNYELLFSWIKSRPRMQVKWMLHDCWAFTGHCAYFTAAGCEKWQQQCGECPLLREYPAAVLRDGSSENYRRKKTAFQNAPDLELIVPSRWLENLVKESFLSQYPITVKPHRVDRTIFRPTPGDFREHYGLTNKKIVLGVANIWEKRKGLSDFLELAGMLPDQYQIVLVGLSEKQRQNLPKNVTGLPRTDSPKELAEIYTAADVFLNPSVEETFGLTGLEAAECGTKTICYKGTACQEVAETTGGIAVDQDPQKLLEAVVNAAT